MNSIKSVYKIFGVSALCILMNASAAVAVSSSPNIVLFTVDDMEIGSANRAGANADADLIIARTPEVHGRFGDVGPIAVLCPGHAR